MDTPSITGWRRFAAMEPLAFALLFSYSLSDNVLTDLVVYQSCKTIAGFNVSECNILHENSTSQEAMRIEKLVQPYTGVYFVLSSCIEVMFPTILSLFLGPWSDKYGRKPLLVVPFTGLFLYYIGIAILSTLNINPYWFLLPSIPKSLLGGFPAILLTFFCYISDITDQENRVWHLACIETTLFTGLLLGIFVGPVVFKTFGYTVLFSLSGGMSLFAVLYAIFAVKETVIHENERTFKSIFDLSLVKELFCAISKKRAGFDRCLVWCCLSAIALHVVVMEGNGSVSFLFASSKLGWDVSKFSIYSGVHLIIAVAGMLFLIKLVGSFLNFPDIVIIVLSCLSISAANFFKAFVTKPWQMYLSSSIGMFGASTVPVIRGIISKSVPQKDVGKAFSLTTIMEMIVPFATTPLYLYIYMHSLNQYPSPVWFLSAVIPLGILLLGIIIEMRWRKLKDTQYTAFISETN